MTRPNLAPTPKGASIPDLQRQCTMGAACGCTAPERKGRKALPGWGTGLFIEICEANGIELSRNPITRLENRKTENVVKCEFSQGSQWPSRARTKADAEWAEPIASVNRARKEGVLIILIIGCLSARKLINVTDYQIYSGGYNLCVYYSGSENKKKKERGE